MPEIDFFPPPSTIPVSVLSPTRWAGATPDSQLTLQKLLQENHDELHIFYNELRFHNHISHHLLALWALGANKEVLKVAYEHDTKIQNPVRRASEVITVDNFHDHLEDENLYSAYLKFFSEVVKEKGPESVGVLMEEFVFSDRANYGIKTKTTSLKNPQPKMLNRFLAGLLHPAIYVGYGAEFGLPGMVVEGLALTAVHQTTPGFDIFVEPFIASGSDAAVEQVTSNLNSLSVKPNAAEGVHALTILARVMKEPTMVIKEMDEKEMFSFLPQKGNALSQYTSAWSFNLSNPNEVERKIEELQWMNVLIYTAAGFRKHKEFQADFYFMHLVTSSLFLPSLTAHLSPSSREALLRGYLGASLAIYVARGRPNIDPVPLFESADFSSMDSTLNNTPAISLPLSTSTSANPNPWLPVIQKAIVHPDDHLAKFQRAVAHYSILYGLSKAGSLDGRGIELPGVEKVDGTLFVRAGVLTQKRVREESWRRGDAVLLGFPRVLRGVE
ncbi:hypothetical protein BT96DRAFT_1019364 [Gymnopus androsaceus JB14]|uniref:Uncharacterized protein n=1 Tax=Gymnopus androsaceus JB14 TaxID=1447944 RepID=A0A6A4HQR3_9AGAR|nr:hypothetical protein BT96DRAFT_1019364 [Gymnopus androsaceus JB14]